MHWSPKSALTSFSPSSSCTHATFSSCCSRHGNCCGCCQISTASPPATAKKSLFAVSCRKASEMEGCAGELWILHFPKRSCTHGVAPKLGRCEHSFQLRVFSHHMWSKSDHCFCHYILRNGVKLLTWIVCITGDLHGQLEDLLLIFYKVRKPFPRFYMF